MEQHFINVTRWLNQEQKFVEVGTLFWDDTLERENPLIGFEYHPEYLQHHQRLLPAEFDNHIDKETVMGDVNNNDLIPNYFKQFLPSEYSKLVFNSIGDDYIARDQFHQLKYITEFKGGFGAIQLDYSSTAQVNKLPTIEEAAKLLDNLIDKQFDSLERPNLTALYHPSAIEPIVSFYQEVDGQYLHSTLKRRTDEKEINRQMLMRHVMTAAGADCAIPMKIKLGDHWYLSQTTGEQIIGERAFMFNTVPVSVAIADSRKISNFEQLNFTHINAALREALPDTTSNELLTRALFAHIFQQKDFTAHDMRLKESASGEWELGPQEILPTVSEEKIPYKTPFTDTISSYEQIKVTDGFINMVAKTWDMPLGEVKDIITKIADGLSQYSSMAIDFGLSHRDVETELNLIRASGVLNFANPKLDNSTELGMDLT